MDDVYDELDATGLAAAIRARELTGREVVELALARIDARDPLVNAVTEVRAEAALADADAGGAGPLAGVPFVVKDLGIDVEGMRSTACSRLFADVVAEADSLLVQRYRAAGLVVIATTNAAELGRSPSTEPLLNGPTRNPHDLRRSAGGSSGGTAAAIAAGMVPAGHGNDGGGSIRIPASACGLVGLKPTRGRTPSLPRLNALSYPVGINHVLTRTVRDSALLLDVAAGRVAGEAFCIQAPERPYVEEVQTPPGRLRVAMSTVRPDGQGSDPACVAAVEATARLLESLGHDVEAADPEHPYDAITSAMATVMTAPLAADVDARLADLGRELRDDDLEPFTRMLYELGKAVTGPRYVTALRDVERAGFAVGAFFESFDVLLTPTMAVPPPPLGLLDPTDVDAMARNAGACAAHTGLANVTGQPALSLPLATFDDGLPLGVQLSAASGREDVLLRVAAQLEETDPWTVAPAWPARGQVDLVEDGALRDPRS